MPTRAATHPGIDFEAKLPLGEPQELSPRGIPAKAQERVQALNERLTGVFRHTRTELPKLVRQVCTMLLLTPEEVADRIGIRKMQTYEALEGDLTQQEIAFRRIHFHEILELWRRRGISAGIREQCLQLLNGGSDLNAFYDRMGFELGHEEVRGLVRKAKVGKSSNIYNTLWQRAVTQTVPDCAEVLSHVDVLYGGKRDKEGVAIYDRRLQQAEQIWWGDKAKHYEGRELEEPLMEVLLALELDLARRDRLTLTQATLRDQHQFTPSDAEQLLRCEYLPWSSVEACLHSLPLRMSVQKLKGAWEEEIARERKRRSFPRVFCHAMEQKELNFGDLARSVGVKTPEERGKDTKVEERSQRYRHDREVSKVVMDLERSEQVAVEKLLALVAVDNAHRDELRGLYREERARRLKRMGSWKEGEGFEMQIARELAGVPNTASLARLRLGPKATKHQVAGEAQRLQRLERQEGEMTSARRRELRVVIAGLRDLAEHKAADALEQFAHYGDASPTWYQFSTIRDMVTKLKLIKHGSSKDVSHAMREYARGDFEWLRNDLILRMEEGSYVPSLPSLHVLPRSCASVDLPEEVRRDWYATYPLFLRERDEYPVAEPLARVLCTHVASRDEDPARFYRERYTGGVGTKAAHDYYRFHRHGVRPEWDFLEGTLLAAGVSRGDHNYCLARELYENGGDIRAAVKKVKPILRMAKLELHPVTLVGLSLDELGMKG